MDRETLQAAREAARRHLETDPEVYARSARHYELLKRGWKILGWVFRAALLFWSAWSVHLTHEGFSFHWSLSEVLPSLASALKMAVVAVPLLWGERKLLGRARRLAGESPAEHFEEREWKATQSLGVAWSLRTVRQWFIAGGILELLQVTTLENLFHGGMWPRITLILVLMWQAVVFGWRYLMAEPAS